MKTGTILDEIMDAKRVELARHQAEVPQAELLRYATELRSQTQGLGSFTMSFDHYEGVPQHLLPSIVAHTKEQEEA